MRSKPIISSQPSMTNVPDAAGYTPSGEPQMILPIVGATPADINEMLDILDDGEAVVGAPDVNLYERSFDECYLVQYDQADHNFEDYVGVVFN